ncbi:hypothetical protein CAPTEDRAFT_197535 [Capitella teleta]|uniref:C2 domain-containing protein n=1 Tax=Capitella teleta TaxID=283909 RepID=R7UXT0_CAPTE|nr:hypothetical protein CAPTEDRAFT_197535 [Capitella teleta]|eukprot:ELU08216.1 hypothetical protein CAPTEDRAFT_197535 [Capitella teleta]
MVKKKEKQAKKLKKRDMGSLVLEVLTGPTKVIVGRCQIDEIGILAPNRPINGFFPVFSADSEKIAELQVSATLESLTVSYDSSSSAMPTPDMSLDPSCCTDDSHGIHPRVAPIAPAPKPALSSTEDLFASPQAPKFVKASPKRNRNPLRESLRSSGSRKSRSSSPAHHYSELRIQGSKAPSAVRSRTISPPRSPKIGTKGRKRSASPNRRPLGNGTTDLVSALLVRGNKLKEALITSRSDVIETESFLPHSRKVEGRLLGGTAQDDMASDVDNRAIDLLVGSPVDDHQLQINTDDDESGSILDTIGVGSERSSRRRSRRRSSSIDEPGNRRPLSSRNSSCSSLNLEKEPVRETDAHKRVTRRKKKKTRSKSKSRSRSQSSERKPLKAKKKKKRQRNDSDSDARASESSRVSFDPVASDVDDSASLSMADSKISDKNTEVDGMSIQRLTLLGRVHVARVTIDHIALVEENSVAKTKGRNGKPPTPRKTTKNQTFFVEYQFPVVATSRDKYQPNAMATEVMRAASKKVTNALVNFSHRSVFPVLFDEDAIHKWWRSILIFKVFSKGMSQKVPKLVGMCSVPLKSVLKSDALHLQRELEVRDRSQNIGKNKSTLDNSISSKQGSQWPLVGMLKINIELASDSRDFSTALAKTRLAEMTNHKIVPIPQRKAAEDRIPGKNFPRGLAATNDNKRDRCTRNLYLTCRMFWSEDSSSSNVCWGTTNPEFNFSQVAPMLLTASVLERMKNNFVVVEVWDKKTTSEKDQLVGIVKLPLHQFYLSYRDRRMANTLLKSQLPVVAVDSYLPIVSPFSGDHYGRLQVLLAMGSLEQIMSIQQAKKVEHVFEVSVDSIQGLSLLENMIWGEADCFVQYHFPSASAASMGAPALKAFRTATTLCVPDPVFNDIIRHKIVLPDGTPVQREILTACAGVGGGSGGIPFEIWCRHYYPNVRDQVIAKGLLPLAKVCAMVTMQRGGLQTFSLQLSSLFEADEKSSNQPGILNLSMSYKPHSIKTNPLAMNFTNSMGSTQLGATVCISVGVLRASGLKTAAEELARLNPSLQYAAEVGVNTYVRMRLSFLQKEDERVTRTVARSFAPDFSFHVDFPCPLLWTEPGNDALSLAEILEDAEAVFELWHQVPHGMPETEDPFKYTASNDIRARQLVSLSGDVLLGTTSVPLIALLQRKTGVIGWHAVHLPNLGWTASSGLLGQSEDSINRRMKPVIGGLEVSIKLAHHDDLHRLMDAARGVGWAPTEYEANEYNDEEYEGSQAVTITVDAAHFPLANAVITGQSHLDPNARCYLRHKFYDKNAVCSHMCEMEDINNFISSDLQHHMTHVVRLSAPFMWYLQEERLEVQTWVTYHRDDGQQRPRQRDKLIGSAFIDLSALSDRRRKAHRVRKYEAPSCYVSYQTADDSDLSYTSIIEHSRSPTWNHNHATHLDKALFSLGNKNLVFKVWHKAQTSSTKPDKSVDSVLGFVSVDLSLLTSGLQQISGCFSFNPLLNSEENLEDLDVITGKLKERLDPSATLRSEDEGHNSSKPLSTSSALITCTGTFGTEQLRATQEWEANHHDDWAGSTVPSNQAEGVAGWERSTGESTATGGVAGQPWHGELNHQWPLSSENLLTTGQPSEYLLSTQEGSSVTREEVASAMQETLDINTRESVSLGFDVKDSDKVSTEMSDYADTLQKAQTLLKAIGQGTFTPKEDLIQRVEDLSIEVEEDHHDEDDTFAKVWQLRTENVDEHSGVSSDVEETLVMPKALNNVSSANFMNSIEQEPTGRIDTDDTWFTDPLVEQRKRPADHFPLSSKVFLESSDTSSLVSRNLLQAEGEILQKENAAALARASRTSSERSSKSSKKSIRKAAAFRREYQQRNRDGYSSSEEEEEEDRSRSRKGRRSISSTATQLEKTLKSLKANTLPQVIADEVIEREKAEAAKKFGESFLKNRTNLQRLTTKSRPAPSTDQAQRIAKIFAQKFT